MNDKKLKKEYYNIFKNNMLMLEVISYIIDELMVDFDKTFEYMQSTDNNLQEYLDLLKDEQEILNTILLDYSAIMLGFKKHLGLK